MLMTRTFLEFSDFLLTVCLPGLDDITSSHVVDRGKYSYFMHHNIITLLLAYTITGRNTINYP